MRFATSTGALMAMMALLGGLPGMSHAQNGGWAVPAGEQAYLQNRYPELKGLTNSAADQKKALDLCSKYGASNQATSMPVVRCNAAARVYMSEGQKAVDAEEQRQANLQQQQAADRQHQQAVASEQEQEATLQQLQAEGLQRQQDLDLKHQRAVAIQQQQATKLQQQKIKERANLEECQKSAQYRRHIDAPLIVNIPSTIRDTESELQQLEQMHPTNVSDMDDLRNRIAKDQGVIDLMTSTLADAKADYRRLGADENDKAQLSADYASDNPCAEFGDDAP